jgi:IS5 family transposase
MTLGKSPTSEDVFRSGTSFCQDHVPATSIYALMYRESHRLFPDEAFADLFADIGRASVPPRIVSVVMVLQRLEGLSDREAVDRITFDLRWKYAAGGLDFDYAGFVHTVLVDMRARLRRSERPNRIFEIALEVAREAGLIGRKRVLDSTALYDAVATQDTVTLIRSAIRALLRIVDDELCAELRSCCKRDDDYVAAGKPSCDWDDVQAREALVDALARDAYAVIAALDGRTLSSEILQAAKLVATVVGQDLEQRDDDGIFRIARRVAKDRVISTVDPEARHGHKTAARGFDGYKAHIAVDPDSEIVTATTVTAGNVGDGSVADELVADVLVEPTAPVSPGDVPDAPPLPTEPAIVAASGESQGTPPPRQAQTPIEIYGDASYGTAEFVEQIERAGAEANVKVQPPSAPEGKFAKDAFEVDLTNNTVRCPAGVLVVIRSSTAGSDGLRLASFGVRCNGCELRSQCTEGKDGRIIRVHPREATLQRARARQRDPSWKARYRATRPKVERKIAHLMQRRHGGRRARVRGRARVGDDFALLGAAHNLRRMATLGVHYNGSTWSR